MSEHAFLPVGAVSARGRRVTPRRPTRLAPGFAGAGGARRDDSVGGAGAPNGRWRRGRPTPPSLSLTVDSAFVGPFVTVAMARFHARFPHYGRIELREAEHGAEAEALLSLGGALALVGVAPGPAGMGWACVATTERVVLLPSSHRLAERTAVAVADVLAERELQPAAAGARWLTSWSIAGLAGEATTRVQTTGAFEDALELVAAGAGVMLVPAIAERRHPRTDLRWLPLIDVAPAAIHLAWRTASRVPGLREFVSIADELRREAAANGQPASRRPDPPPACRHYGMIVP